MEASCADLLGLIASQEERAKLLQLRVMLGADFDKLFRQEPKEAPVLKQPRTVLDVLASLILSSTFGVNL